MSTAKVAGWSGVAWILVTGFGVTLFSLAGIPPSFSDSTRYAAFIRQGSTLLLIDAYSSGLSAASLAIFILSTAVAVYQASRRLLLAALVGGLGVISSTFLGVVGLFEMVTVYSRGPCLRPVWWDHSSW